MVLEKVGVNMRFIWSYMFSQRQKSAVISRVTSYLAYILTYVVWVGSPNLLSTLNLDGRLVNAQERSKMVRQLRCSLSETCKSFGERNYDNLEFQWLGRDALVCLNLENLANLEHHRSSTHE